MKPFKFFFGLSIAVMLFFVVAKFLVAAFIIAAIASLIYAVFRRLKDFITYDRFGESYMRGFDSNYRFASPNHKTTEPLFEDFRDFGRGPRFRSEYVEDIRYIDVR